MSAADLLRRGLARSVSIVSGAQLGADSVDPAHLPEQAIFFANHTSHLDFITLWSALPPRLQKRVRPIAARDYWDTGVRRLLAENVFHAFLVDRHGGSQDAGASPSGQLGGMTEVLDGGDSLIIFPEGTRGDGEELAAFHSGLYRLAQHNPVIPAVPVSLGNLGRILPKGEAVPVPHLSSVTFHRPLHVGDAETKDEFLARCRAALLGDH